MNRSNLEEKLTRAARQVLDELVEEYRNQILVRANEAASTLTGDVREISVHDVVTSVKEIEERGGAPPASPFDRVLKMYQVLGVALGGFGFLFYFFREIQAALGLEKRLPLLIAIAGLTLATFSFFASRLREARRHLPARRMPAPKLPDFPFLFITRWRDIELALRNAAAAEFGETVAEEPISVLVEHLVRKGTLNEQDSVRLRRLLKIRNTLIHEGAFGSEEEIASAMREAGRLLHKIASSQSYQR